MVSIITPSYNRAQFLTRCYDSLVKQSSQNFEWIIVDDGSTDNTEEVARTFSSEKLKISYLKKENGGKHTAINLAMQSVKGELTLILDSDDYLTQDAVEVIERDWNRYCNDSNICGLSYLRGNKDGAIIGKSFPRDEYVEHSYICRINHNIWGDKVEVYRSEILRQYPFPVFANETFLGENVIWTQIGYRYKTVFINKIIYICEYLEGGLSESGRRLRVQCPLGGMEYAKIHIDKRIRRSVRFKMILLYLTYARFAGIELKEAISQLRIHRKTAVIMKPLSKILYSKWKKLV